MEIKEAKAHLNERVHYKARDIDADYIFTACTIRKNEKGYFYQAELQDLNNHRSILICKLADVEPIENEI